MKKHQEMQGVRKKITNKSRAFWLLLNTQKSRKKRKKKQNGLYTDLDNWFGMSGIGKVIMKISYYSFIAVMCA